MLKYLSTLALAAALLGCQSDSSQQTNQQPAQQQQTQQGPLSQNQQPAPEVDVSEEEVTVFAKAAMEAQKIQMQSQKEMVGAIQDEGLDVKTYQVIAKATQMGQAPDSISSEQMDKYDSANKSIKKVQTKVQEQVSSVVEEAGMEMERFQKISRAAQQDTQLQRRIQQKISQEMGGRQRMQQSPSNNQ